MSKDPLDEDIFDSPEERAKWVVRFRIAYLIWMIMIIIGLLVIALMHLPK